MFFQYNGIDFELARTNSWSAEAVYSDDGVDYLYTRHRIDIEAQLNPGQTAYELIDGEVVPAEGALPATTFTATRHALMQPRATLYVTDYNGQVVLEIPEPGYAVDAENGPKPIRCEPRVLGASRLWAFRWVVEVCTLECSADETEYGVISCRWQDSHHINQHQLVTRMVTGKMVFRNDVLTNLGVGADFVRGYINITTPPGFQRTAVDVTVQSDGRALTFQIREEEKMADLGETDPNTGASGILQIDGAAGVTSMSTDAGPPGGMSLWQIDLRAYMRKDANQWTVLQYLWLLALTKMSGVGNVAIGIIRHAAVRESMGRDDKWSEITIAFQAKQQNNAVIPSINIDPMRRDLQDVYAPQNGINPAFANKSGMAGTSAVDLTTQDPLTYACLAVVMGEVPSDGTDDVPNTTDGYVPYTRVQAVDVLSEQPSRYNTEDDSAYTLYRASIEISRSTGLYQAPPSGSADSKYSQPPPSASDWGGANGSFSGSSGESKGGLPPSRMFRFHMPVEKMRMTFEAERIGSPPAIPSPSNSDENLVLTWAHLNPISPVVGNDGYTPVFMVKGTYEYALQTPIQPGQNLIMGALPWTTLNFADNVIPPNAFEHGIFDDDQNGGGSQTTGLDT